jgi:hypothetical protein
LLTLKPTLLLSEFLRFYYPYGHIMMALYGTFSAFVCILGARYLYFRMREMAEAKAILAKTKSQQVKFQTSSLIDDLPFLLGEEKESRKADIKDSALA